MTESKVFSRSDYTPIQTPIKNLNFDTPNHDYNSNNKESLKLNTQNKANKDKDILNGLNSIIEYDKSLLKPDLSSPMKLSSTEKYFDLKMISPKRNINNQIKTFNHNNNSLKNINDMNSPKLYKHPSFAKNYVINKIESRSNPASSDSDNDSKSIAIKDYQVSRSMANSRKNSGGKMLLSELQSIKPEKKYQQQHDVFTSIKKGLNELSFSSDSDNMDDKEIKNTMKSMQKLKTVMRKQKILEYEKYVWLKASAKEMKNMVREYFNKVLDQEDIIKLKNERILELERELKMKKFELYEKIEEIKDYRRYRELCEKYEEEIKCIDVEYKVLLNEQNKKLKLLEVVLDDIKLENIKLKKDLSLTKEKEYDLILNDEKNKRDLEELRIEYKTKIVKLDEYNKNVNEEINMLKDDVQKYMIENKYMRAKLEDSNKLIYELEKNSIEDKKSIEDEKLKITEHLESKIRHKKVKIKDLKMKIYNLEFKLNHIDNQNKGFAIEIDKVNTLEINNEKELMQSKKQLNSANHEICELHANNERLRYQNDELSKKLDQKIQNLNEIQNDNQKLINVIKNLEDKLGYQELANKELAEANRSLKTEIVNLHDQRNKLKDEIIYDERQIKFLEDEKTKELIKVESALNGFSNELLKFKEDNKSLKTNEIQLKKDLDICKESRDHYKRKYKALKDMNQSLEKNLYEVDKQVREFTKEKNEEINEYNIKMNAQRQLNSKLKV